MKENPMEYQFKHLCDSQVDEAYRIIELRYSWLCDKGINQYTSPFPTRNNFEKNQRERVNFALIVDDLVVGIVTLTPLHIGEGWEFPIPQNSVWISALFTRTDSVGTGKILLREIENYARKCGMTQMILDCYLDSGFLEPYYKSNGFETIAHKQFVFGERTFTAALMKKVCG